MCVCVLIYLPCSPWGESGWCVSFFLTDKYWSLLPLWPHASSPVSYMINTHTQSWNILLLTLLKAGSCLRNRLCACVWVCVLPDWGMLQLRDQHPAAPGHQVPLCGHLAAWGVAVHLADALDLPATTQTHVRRGVHLCGRTHRSWGRPKLVFNSSYSKWDTCFWMLTCTISDF